MKRVADETITKEHGSTPNTSALQSDGRKMATAAQLAARKIAQPKSRNGRSHGSRATTPTTPSILDQPQQSFAVPSSGFQFGSNTANSFPPQASTQQSFNFGAPNTASSFTFGQPNTNGQSQSNPFANMNGGTNGVVQQDNNMMDDSPQKPAFSNSLFQFGGSTQNTAPSNAFNFGQSVKQQESTGGFGNNLFSQTKPQEQPSNTNLFGQMSQTQQNGILNSGGLFGQSSVQTSTSAPLSAPLFAFGNTSTPAVSSTPKPASLFKFGEPSATPPAATQSEQPKSPFGFSFGQSSSSEKPAAEKEPDTGVSKPLFQFGQPAPASPAHEAVAAPSQPGTGLFAPTASASTTAPSSSSLFGVASKINDEQSKPQRAEEGEQADEPAPPKNPFASLFAPKPSNAVVGDSAKPAQSPFKFGDTTAFTPTTNSVDATSTSPNPFSKSAQVDSPRSVFNFGQPNPSSGGVFSPKASSTMPSNNLFNLNKATPSAEPTKQDPTDLSTATPAASTAPSLFGNTSQSIASSPQKPMESFAAPKATPLGNFGQSPAPIPAKTFEGAVASDEASTINKKRALFTGTSTPFAMAQAALGPVAGSSSNVEAPSNLLAPSKPSTLSQPATRAVSTEGAPQIPRHLSGDKYKSYDENYRLRNLNRLFKNKIATLDVDKFDVINLIQNYLDHRESIGEGLGRYGRVKAGVKRKATDVDDLHEEATAQGKKAKPAETGPSALDETQQKPTASTTTTPSSLFSSLTSPKPSNTLSSPQPTGASQTSNLFRSMIPSAAGGPTATTNVFSNVFSSSTSKSTTPPSSPPKPAVPQMPRFEVPKFGGGSSGGDFMAAFAKASAENAKKFEDAAKEKRKADEFDSDEDDADAWEKQYEEEQRAKKAKIEAVGKGGFTPTIATAPSKPLISSATTMYGSSQDTAIEVGDSTGNSGSSETSGSGNSGDDEQEQVTDDLPEDEVDDETQDANAQDEEEGEPIPELEPSQSLFGRITRDKPVQSTEKDDAPIRQPAANNSFKPGLMFGNVGKSTPDTPNFSPLTPANTMPRGDFVPTTTFNYTPTPASVSAKPWNTSSVLGGGTVREGPIPGEGLFGSRPSTPQPLSDADVKTTSIFGTSRTSTTPSDNTWKRGSEIKFGTSPEKLDVAPSVEITSATPPPLKENVKPFANLFGQSVDKSNTTNGASTSLGFNFGNAANTTSSITPVPGFLSAAAYLGGGTASGTSSRATSPGIATDNESVATDNTEDYSNEPQASSLMSSNAGEEEEDPIYESKANIYQMFREPELVELDELKAKQNIGHGRGKLIPGWNLKGIGNVRVLKHKTTNKCRIVFRAEPNANILMNARLLSTAKYTSQTMGKSNGAVQFPILGEDKKMQTWMLKVKTKSMSDEMARLLENNKTN